MNVSSEYWDKLILVVFVGFTVFLGWFSLRNLHNIQIQTDIGALILRADLADESSLMVAQTLLDEQKRSVTFLIEGERVEEVRDALIDALEASPDMHLSSNDNNERRILDLLSEQQLAWSSEIHPIPEDDNASLDKRTKALQDNILSTLGSPVAVTSLIDLDRDPFLFAYGYGIEVLPRLAKLAPRPKSDEILFRMSMAPESIETLPPQMLVDRVTSVVSKFSTEKTTITWSGFIRFAAEGAARMRREVQLYTTLSAVMVVVLSLIVFRSGHQLLLSAFSILYGLLAGTCFTLGIFGSIHAVTLGFGSALAGVSVDYALHFFSEQLVSPKRDSGRDILRKIIGPISIGTFTSVLVFCGLGFTGFPGLSELSIFSVTSILATFLTVIAVFPLCAGGGFESRRTGALRLAKLLFALISKFQTRCRLNLLYGGLFLLGLPAWQTFTNEDDIRTLQTPAAELLEIERKIRDRVPFSPTAFLVLKSNSIPTLEQDLRKAEAVLNNAQKAGQIGSYLPLSEVLPFSPSNRATKLRRVRLLSGLKEDLIHELKEVGYQVESLDSWFDTHTTVTNIDVEGARYFAKARETPLKNYLLTKNDEFFIAVPFEATEAANSDISELPGEVIELSSLISSLLGAYRSYSVYVASVSYVIIFLLFWWRYRFKVAVRLVMPSVATGYVLLCGLSYFGCPINFFHILGLIVVLGLSVDYNVLFNDKQGLEDSVCLTVILSTLSTVLAFFPLTFSSTLVLRSLGVTIGVGVLLATFFAPAAREYKK
jgi:predicted exporter